MTHDKTNLADRLIAAEGGYTRHEHQHIGGAFISGDLILRMNLKPGQSILDVGCGVGATIRQLADMGLGPLHGVDSNADYITTARDLCMRHQRGSAAQFTRADALRLPFTAGSFDAVISIHLGMMVADKHMLYAEMARVLKPGGVMGILDVTAGDNMGDLTYPLPWADTRQQSYLVHVNDLADEIGANGFKCERVLDKSKDALGALTKAVDMRFASILMGSEGRARVENLHQAFANRACRLTLILARKIAS